MWTIIGLCACGVGMSVSLTVAVRELLRSAREVIG